MVRLLHAAAQATSREAPNRLRSCMYPQVESMMPAPAQSPTPVAMLPLPPAVAACTRIHLLQADEPLPALKPKPAVEPPAALGTVQ